MVTTCAAYGCRNRAEDGSKVKFHKFPSIKRADLHTKWILAMKRKDFKPGASAKLCSDHFTSEHFEIGLKRKTLKPDAIRTSEKEKAKAEAKVTRRVLKRVQLPPSLQNLSHTEVNTVQAHKDEAQDHGVPLGNHVARVHSKGKFLFYEAECSKVYKYSSETRLYHSISFAYTQL